MKIKSTIISGDNRRMKEWGRLKKEADSKESLMSRIFKDALTGDISMFLWEKTEAC